MDQPTNSNEVYLAYLFSAGKNFAVIGTDTLYQPDPRDGSRELRKPNLLSQPKLDGALYKMDRAAPLITTWKRFYEWLGRGNGWASFTKESARELVPHWLTPDVLFECVRQVDDDGLGHPPWIDATLPSDAISAISRESLENIIGDAEQMGLVTANQLWDNLVITGGPIFP